MKEVTVGQLWMRQWINGRFWHITGGDATPVTPLADDVVACGSCRPGLHSDCTLHQTKHIISFTSYNIHIGVARFHDWESFVLSRLQVLIEFLQVFQLKALFPLPEFTGRWVHFWHPSWRPELMGVKKMHPSWRAVNSGAEWLPAFGRYSCPTGFHSTKSSKN